jgi:homoserine O-succinyltransferase
MEHPSSHYPPEIAPVSFPGHPPAPDRLALGRGTGVSCLDIGLVNNMPDGALQDTERQFLQLAAAARDVNVRFSLFTLPGIARSERARHYLRERYGTIDALRCTRMDALIITGTEPHAADLMEEPFWAVLTEVLDWADNNTVSTMVSCLAAHAAVLHFDGIRPRRLDQKCSGVFDHHKASDHPLIAGIPAPWRAVHSRRNGLCETTLLAHDYAILGRSNEAGVHLFTRQRQSLFVCFQGHPEYERDTLLHEYKRDIGRFLRGEQDSYPMIPSGYFEQDIERLLSEFQTAALVHRDPCMMALFPNEPTTRTLVNTWLPAAQSVFRNWLYGINTRKLQWSSLTNQIAT